MVERNILHKVSPVGRRSALLLVGLALVAIANGLILGLALFAMFAAGLKLLGMGVPSLGYAWFAGGCVALGLLGTAISRERALRKEAHSLWRYSGTNSNIAVEQSFRRLVDLSSLEHAPALRLIASEYPNAFVVGASRDDASVVVTTGLLEQLDADELEAVLAQQLAQVEYEDLKVVGLADAIADSISGLSRAKARVFGDTESVFLGILPLLAVLIGGGAIIGLLFLPSEGPVLIIVRFLFILAFLYVLWLAALASLAGLARLFLFITFFGPLSLVEMALAPPTAVLLSRVVSRARVYEADCRAVHLTDNQDALVAALGKLGHLESSLFGGRTEFRLRRKSEVHTIAGSELRFALFVAPRVQDGLQAWVDRFYSTHPPISQRQKAIQALVEAPEKALALAE